MGADAARSSTQQITTSSAPSWNLSARSTSATSLIASWQPPTTLQYFQLAYARVMSTGLLSTTSVIDRIRTTSQQVGNLLTGATYSIRVRGVTGTKATQWSSPVTVLVADPTPTTVAPTTTAPTTVPSSTTTAPTTTVPGGATSGCGLSSPAFCYTFDAPANGGTRTGDLDPTLWGVSRVGNVNPGQSQIDDISTTSMTGCRSATPTFTPDDVRICNGQLFETVNDGGGVANLDMYPKQPFDFAGRTGTITFDVSADSDGSHAAWPEFGITDKPVPGARGSISGQVPAAAVNEIGFALDGGCGIAGQTGVGQVFITKNNVYSEPSFTTPNCITKGSSTAMNHIEVRLSQNQLEVWGTDAGATTLKQLAVADNLGLTMTKGLVWLNDVHYNARKAIEPCECGTQYNHTFVWDNLGFDGPNTYRDLGFDVPDANVAGGTPFAGDATRRVGYLIGTGPTTLTVNGVHRDQTPTGALVVLNTYSFAAVIPSISINNGPPINTPWPYDTQTYSWRSIAIPVPLDQIHDGTNTITLTSADDSTIAANISIILVAASPVP